MPSVIAWVGLICWRLCVRQLQHLWPCGRGSNFEDPLVAAFWGMLYDIVLAGSAHVLKPAPAPSLQEKPRRHRSVWIHCIVIAFKDATSFFEPQLIHSFGRAAGSLDLLPSHQTPESCKPSFAVPQWLIQGAETLPIAPPLILAAPPWSLNEKSKRHGPGGGNELTTKAQKREERLFQILPRPI